MTQKHVVITGVSSGIGGACASLFARQGAAVTGIDIKPPQTCEGCFIQADLSSPESVQHAIAGMAGPVDVLCNIAGLPGSSPSELILRVNVLGLRELTLGLLDRMPQSAVVINLASMAGSGWRDRLPVVEEFLALEDRVQADAWMAGHPMEAADAYRFSKECVIVQTAQWAARFLARQVRFLSVSPGPVATPILEDFRKSMAPGQVDVAIDAVGRAATAEDIARVVMALTGQELGWLNGIDVPAEGGLSAVRRYGVRS